LNRRKIRVYGIWQLRKGNWFCPVLAKTAQKRTSTLACHRQTSLAGQVVAYASPEVQNATGNKESRFWKKSYRHEKDRRKNLKLF
jgi:hypothetical protein